MKDITTCGLDIAKNVFQVHGVNANAAVVIQRKLRRKLARSRDGIVAIVEGEPDITMPELTFWIREVTAFTKLPRAYRVFIPLWVRKKTPLASEQEHADVLWRVTCAPIVPSFERRVRQSGDGHEKVEIHGRTDHRDPYRTGTRDGHI